MSLVLVTGATGFLGSVLTRKLLARDLAVRVYHREASSMDLLDRVEQRVEHAVGDIRDAAALDAAFDGVTCVYHAAARVGFGGRRERQAMMGINVDGTAAVINAALRHGVQRLVHVSSMAAFGRPEHPEGVIDERNEWQRSKVNSVYAQSKYLSELEVHRGIAEGLDAVITNPSLIFGAGRTGDNTRRIIERVRTRSLPAVPAGGTNVVDVEDVAEALFLAMDRGRSGERYFLGSENLSWRTIIDELARAFDVEPPRLQLPPLPALGLAYASEALAFATGSPPLITRETARAASRTYRYSNRKARRELGWNPRPFSETARRIAEEI